MRKLTPTEALVNKVIALSFKPGDEIVCIDITSFSPFSPIDTLTVGKVYRVIGIEDSGAGSKMVHVRNDKREKFGYFALRFKKKKEINL
jgi:hypothetical protein